MSASKTRAWKVKARSKAVYSRSTFARDIRGAVRGFWTGTYDYYRFFEEMGRAIDRGLTSAWYNGAAECGVLPEELTIDEIKVMRFRISEQMNYLNSFAEAIETNSKANKGKLTPLMKRAQLWINQYGSVMNEAKVLACKDQKLKWVLGMTEQHCRTCNSLDGKVKRASFWQKLGVRPQNAPNPLLECQGWNCGCSLVHTDEPVSRGAMPSLP